MSPFASGRLTTSPPGSSRAAPASRPPTLRARIPRRDTAKSAPSATGAVEPRAAAGLLGAGADGRVGVPTARTPRPRPGRARERQDLVQPLAAPDRQPARVEDPPARRLPEPRRERLVVREAGAGHEGIADEDRPHGAAPRHVPGVAEPVPVRREELPPPIHRVRDAAHVREVADGGRLHPAPRKVVVRRVPLPPPGVLPGAKGQPPERDEARCRGRGRRGAPPAPGTGPRPRHPPDRQRSQASELEVEEWRRPPRSRHE